MVSPFLSLCFVKSRPRPSSAKDNRIVLGAGTGVSNGRSDQIRGRNLNLGLLGVAVMSTQRTAEQKSSPHREGMMITRARLSLV